MVLSIEFELGALLCQIARVVNAAFVWALGKSTPTPESETQAGKDRRLQLPLNQNTLVIRKLSKFGIIDL